MSGAEAVAAQRPGTHDLAQDEIERFLHEYDWGVLSTVVDGRPYAVPVTFAFDDRGFYIATGPGRKARGLGANPHVCLTVTDVRSHDRWRSVVVLGRAERVGGLGDRLRALARLRRRVGAARPPSPRDAARLAGARVFRIVPSELTGRASG